MSTQPPAPLNPLEVGGVIVGAVVATGGLIGALTVIWRALKAVPHLIRRLGHWVVRFVRTVNVIAALPDRLEGINTRISEHLTQAEQQRVEIQGQLDTLLSKQQVVVHEVQHNGGSSMKDALREIGQKLDIVMQGLDESQVTGNFKLPRPLPTGPTTGEVSLSA